MRLYTFCNYYLSSIQQGIQTAHIVSELMSTQFEVQQKNEKIFEWAKEHKTIICCNGGNAKSLYELTHFFCNHENPYPWIFFREDEDSLDGALTAIGILLPEEIYEAKIRWESGVDNERVKLWVVTNGSRTDYYRDPLNYTYQLIDKIKSAPLAK